MWGRLLACGGLFARLLLSQTFSFALLGDRTGEAVDAIYQQVWKAAAAEHPAFVVTVGDTIQGLQDETARAQWQEVQRLLGPYKKLSLYLAPGNHDIWSPLSEQLFREYAKHPPHYSFDYQQAHFTILDNSRTEELSPEELDFLEQDLKAHAGQPVKFVVSHRPSWLLNVALRNPRFRLQELAKQYGVSYVVAGHVHQMLRFELEGVTYLSMASAGGHLRGSGEYTDGWFFGHALVTVRDSKIDFRIEERKGRVTSPADWGMAGLVKR